MNKRDREPVRRSIADSGGCKATLNLARDVLEMMWAPCLLVIAVIMSSGHSTGIRICVIAIAMVMTLQWGFHLNIRDFPRRRDEWSREMNVAKAMRERGYELADIALTICLIRKTPTVLWEAGLSARNHRGFELPEDVYLDDPRGASVLIGLPRNVRPDQLRGLVGSLLYLFNHPIEIRRLDSDSSVLVLLFVVREPNTEPAEIASAVSNIFARPRNQLPGRFVNVFSSAAFISKVVSSDLDGLGHRILRFEKSCRDCWFFSRILFAVALKWEASK